MACRLIVGLSKRINNCRPSGRTGDTLRLAPRRNMTRAQRSSIVGNKAFGLTAVASASLLSLVIQLICRLKPFGVCV